jgi:hypothetical protein
MVWRGKESLSMGNDVLIPSTVPIPKSNLRNLCNLRMLILFKLSRYSGCTFSIEPSSFLFLIYVYPRPSAV